MGKNAAQPIEPGYGALVARLLMVGISQQRRPALPAQRITAHSAMSNYRI